MDDLFCYWNILYVFYLFLLLNIFGNIFSFRYIFSNCFLYWDLFNIWSLLRNIFGNIFSFCYIFSKSLLYWDLFHIRFLLRNIFNLCRIAYLWNIFSLMLNSIIISILFCNWNCFIFNLSFIISVYFLNWDIFSFCDLFIFNIFSLEWDIFKSWFSFKWLFETILNKNFSLYNFSLNNFSFLNNRLLSLFWLLN